MNKMFIIFLFSLLLLVLPGCLFVSLGYTPDSDLPDNYTEKKYDVTFSVEYYNDRNDVFGLASQEQYITWIKQYLQETKAFRSVAYKPITQKSNYHINFIVHYSFMTVRESALLGYFCGLTGLAIPTYQTLYMDISTVLYLRNNPVYSPSTAEALRGYIWLPFLPVGLIWNQWWALTTQEKKCCRFLINEVVNYQKNHL